MSFPVDLTEARPECEHCDERIRWSQPTDWEARGLLGSYAWRHVRTDWARCNVEGLAFAAPRIAPTTGMITERAEAGEL